MMVNNFITPAVRISVIRSCVTAVIFCGAVLEACAHADLLALIDGVTKRIAAEPKNASLYVLRGELYRAHADWKLAETDYDHAGQLDPKLDDVLLAKGKLAFDMGNDSDAKSKLDGFLTAQPLQVEGLVARAHTFARMGERLKAAADLGKAIENSQAPRPDYYLERSKWLAEASERAEALKGLDDGIRRLGPLAALQLAAIELECAQSHFDSALKRLDQIAGLSAHKEKWLVQRGEILAQAGRRDEARQILDEAHTAIESLPIRIRTSPATSELRKRITDALASVEKNKSSSLTLNH